jgi:DNA-binding NarL/FixJ family response regulator
VSPVARAVEEAVWTPVRVVVAMPHPRLRAAIVAALESTRTITVVAQSGDIRSAVDSTRALRPGAILLGTSLVVGDVVESVLEIARAIDGVPMVLAGHEDTADYVSAVVGAGAAAYVPLHGDAHAFAGILRCVAAAEATHA